MTSVMVEVIVSVGGEGVGVSLEGTGRGFTGKREGGVVRKMTGGVGGLVREIDKGGVARGT